MSLRRVAAALSAACIAVVLLAVPAEAAPGPVKQTNTGTGSGAGFTASLKRAPTAGNVIVIVVGLDFVGARGTLQVDDVANVVDMAESWTAFAVEGAPYAIVWGVKADPAVRTWGFHGTAQPVAWLTVELSGVETYQPSGVPIWDGGGKGSAHAVGGIETQLNSGHGAETAVPREFLIAPFVARVEEPPTFAALAGPSVPQVVSFSNTYEQPGTWSRLGSTVATATAGPSNVRLDVAFKASTVVGSYDCLAVWDSAPSGMAALLVGLHMV